MVPAIDALNDCNCATIDARPSKLIADILALYRWFAPERSRQTLDEGDNWEVLCLPEEMEAIRYIWAADDQADMTGGLHRY